jgi:hypothetical protein
MQGLQGAFESAREVAPRFTGVRSLADKGSLQLDLEHADAESPRIRPSSKRPT